MRNKILVPCKTKEVFEQYKKSIGKFAHVFLWTDSAVCGLRGDNLIVTPEWTAEEIEKELLPLIATSHLELYLKVKELTVRLAQCELELENNKKL